jgi:hypothetical protein
VLYLNIYGFHLLRNHIHTIKLFGCTDSFSMQLVSAYLHCT